MAQLRLRLSNTANDEAVLQRRQLLGVWIALKAGSELDKRETRLKVVNISTAITPMDDGG